MQIFLSFLFIQQKQFMATFSLSSPDRRQPQQFVSPSTIFTNICATKSIKRKLHFYIMLLHHGCGFQKLIIISTANEARITSKTDLGPFHHLRWLLVPYLISRMCGESFRMENINLLIFIDITRNMVGLLPRTDMISCGWLVGFPLLLIIDRISRRRKMECSTKTFLETRKWQL